LLESWAWMYTCPFFLCCVKRDFSTGQLFLLKTLPNGWIGFRDARSQLWIGKVQKGESVKGEEGKYMNSKACQINWLAQNAFLMFAYFNDGIKTECTSLSGERGSVMIKALCYKPESRRFETRWGDWTFSIYLILPAALGTGIHSASNRNECQNQKNNVFGE
jgi:hypothetical protein